MEVAIWGGVVDLGRGDYWLLAESSTALLVAMRSHRGRSKKPFVRSGGRREN